MKYSLLLHGRGGNTNENCFPWLKGELKKTRLGNFCSKFTK